MFSQIKERIEKEMTYSNLNYSKKEGADTIVKTIDILRQRCGEVVGN